MNGGELILYTAEDGSVEIQLRAFEGTVWLNQLEMAALFGTTKQNIAKHLKAIFAEGELVEESVVNQWLTTAADGKKYRVSHYKLDAILAVGYRVRSPRGTQFRQWATTHLREYLVKGFVLDDARLKEPGGWDYFDELLARIRDIRASEKRFYQKIRDIYATAVDYDNRSEAAQLFFKKVQNKMLWAATGHTTPEHPSPSASSAASSSCAARGIAKATGRGASPGRAPAEPGSPQAIARANSTRSTPRRADCSSTARRCVTPIGAPPTSIPGLLIGGSHAINPPRASASRHATSEPTPPSVTTRLFSLARAMP